MGSAIYPGKAMLRGLLLVLFSCLLSACGGEPPHALRIGLAGAAANLDPRLATDATSARINRLLYRRLVSFDAQSRPRADLARWQRLSPTRYRFILGEAGRRFHDGSRLTARDVQATYASLLDPASLSPHKSRLGIITAMDVVDDDTLDFQLARPEALFPGYLDIGILPVAGIAAGHPFHQRPVGSGPFRFAAWPETDRLRLLRLRDGLEVEFLRIKDPTVRVLKLLRGEIHLVQNDLPAELVAYLRKEKDIRVQQAQGSNFSYLGFNLQDPLTSRLGVRQAIAHAIDRAAIIRYVLGGAARPAAGLLPPEHWAGHPTLPAYRYDPARARQLLREEGLAEAPAGGALTLSYKTSSDPVRVRLATIIQQQLAQVGLQVKLQSHDWGTFFGDIKAGRFQMYSLSWVGIKMPDIFRYVFHSRSVPPAGANRGRFFDPRVDAMIDAVEQGADAEIQARGYRELQAYLHARLPYVPLWYEDHVFAARAGIEGYRLAADGNYDGLAQVRIGAETGIMGPP